MTAEHGTHHSYLVRLWQDHPGTRWRVTLTSVAGAARNHPFADLQALFAFLVAQISATAWLGPDDPATATIS